MSCYDSSAFIIFLNTIISRCLFPLHGTFTFSSFIRFYPMLMLSLQFFLIMVGREFGPMLMAEREVLMWCWLGHFRYLYLVPRKAERSCRSWVISRGYWALGGKTLPQQPPSTFNCGHWWWRRCKGVSSWIHSCANGKSLHHLHIIIFRQRSTPRRWYNAVIPIVVAILVVLISLICTGIVGNRKEGSKQNGQNIFSNRHVSLLVIILCNALVANRLRVCCMVLLQARCAYGSWRMRSVLPRMVNWPQCFMQRVGWRQVVPWWAWNSLWRCLYTELRVSWMLS